MMGLLGFHQCPRCSLVEHSMLDANKPMSTECRRCHYAIEDFLNAELFRCLHAGAYSDGCFSLSRGVYNYRQDVLGILNPNSEAIDLTLQGEYVYVEEETSEG